MADGIELNEERVSSAPPYQPDSSVRMRVETDSAFVRFAWMLWLERRGIVRFTAWCVVVIAVIAFLLPKTYRSTTRLMPPDSSTAATLAAAAMMPGGLGSGSAASAGAGGGTAMNIASQLLGLNTNSEVFIGVLRSRSVEDAIIRRFDLAKLYRTSHPEDTRNELKAHTEIAVDRKSGMLSIAVDDRSAERAAQMARTYVEELNKVLASVKTSAAHRERLFIETRLTEVKADLDDSVRQLGEFSSKNTMLDIPQQAKATVESVAQIQAQLFTAQAQLQSLQQIYTDDNVRVRSGRAQIAELQKQLNALGGKGVTADLTSLPSDQLYPSLRQLPLLGLRYLDLYRRSKVNEAIYELLTKQYEIAKIQEARDVPTVQVLDVADVPTRKWAPHRLWIILAGLLVSFVLASAYIILRNMWAEWDDSNASKVLLREMLASARAHTWDSRAASWVRNGLRARVSRLRMAHKTSSSPAS